MKVFRKNLNAKMPVKAGEDMCYDLFACFDGEDIFIHHGEVVVVPLGVHIDLTPYHASLRPRSGLASRGLGVLGGQIDRSYRGEFKVILTNHESRGPAIRISSGDKIVQMKLEEDITVPVLEVASQSELSDSNRGQNGFGSTGI